MAMAGAASWRQGPGPSAKLDWRVGLATLQTSAKKAGKAGLAGYGLFALYTIWRAWDVAP